MSNPTSPAPVIEAHGLAKVYPGGKRALDGVSFQVERGELFALLGPNGSGKTTTVKILTTQLRPTEGRASVSGCDPVRQPDDVRRTFGIVFQEASVDDELTALENMDSHAAMYDVPRASRRKRVEDLLRLVGLWDRKDELVGNFSGGLKRRLELARALLHDPEILLLDEPTLGLDPQTRHLIWMTLMETSRRQGTTIFFHHALHGRSGAPLRPRRHRRSRPPHRPRHAEGVAGNLARRGRAARDAQGSVRR